MNALLELFDKPEKWTKRNYARDINNNSVGYRSKDAVCFCLKGGIYHLYENSDVYIVTWQEAIKKVIKQKYPERAVTSNCPITQFNDHPDTKFNDIIEVIRAAEGGWAENNS